MKETKVMLCEAITLSAKDDSLEYKAYGWGGWKSNSFWEHSRFRISELLETVTIRTKRTAKDELIKELVTPEYPSKPYEEILKKYKIEFGDVVVFNEVADGR